MVEPGFPVYLASSSPRRREILKKIVTSFELVEVDVDESNSTCLDPERLTIRNALKKFLFAKNKIQGNHFLLISADTVVSFQNKIYGKPLTRNDALETLGSLGGKTHEVITGVAVGLIQNDKSNVTLYAEKTLVTFNPLTEQEIISYVDLQKPYDKAGSYGIQELPNHFVKSIHGDFDNIVGLPFQSLSRMIESFSR
jgi:septum formation protein